MHTHAAILKKGKQIASVELDDEYHNYNTYLLHVEEEKTIIEDLIVAAHNSAKSQLKTKTAEEISKATGGLGIPGFKWPL